MTDIISTKGLYSCTSCFYGNQSSEMCDLKREPLKLVLRSCEDFKFIEDGKKEIREKALEIMTTGNPIDYILTEHQKMHVGDRNTAKALLVSIGTQSVLNSQGIHPKISGESGTGKTHCVKSMVHLIPEEYVLEGSVSDKAIFYKKNIKSGTIIFFDDVEPSQGLTGLIKRATSNFQNKTSHVTLTKDRDVITHTIPARMSWWLTSVDDDQSIQLLNRMFGGGVNESEDHDKKVLEHILENGETGIQEYPETNNVKVCREMIREIKKQTFTVKIPFATKIKWSDSKNRRNSSIFLDMIRALTIFNFKQRVTIDGYLIATLEDYENAKELYCSRAENQGLKLSDKELRLCRAMHRRERAYINELQDDTGLSNTSIRYLLKGRGEKDSGLLAKIPALKEIPDDSNPRKLIYELLTFNEDHIFDVVSIDEKDLKETKEKEKILLSQLSHTITQLSHSIINNSIDNNHTITDNEKKQSNDENLRGSLCKKPDSCDSVIVEANDTDSRCDSSVGLGSSNVIVEATDTDKDNVIVPEPLQKLLEQGKQRYESRENKQITFTNIDHFSMWISHVYDPVDHAIKRYTVDDIKKYAARQFKITPEAQP